MFKKSNYEEDINTHWMEEEDEIELMDLLFILIRRWKTIVAIAVPVLIIGLTYAVLKPAMYKSRNYPHRYLAVRYTLWKS